MASGCSCENICSKGQGKASTSPTISFDNGSDSTFNKTHMILRLNGFSPPVPW